MLELMASMKISIRCKETETKSIKMENLQIQDVNKFIDGGVYMLTINKIPLYVGETYNFHMRFSKHLTELYNDFNYFGLSQLEGEYCLGFYIIKDKLPYDRIKLEGNKRHTDNNKGERTKWEKQFINQYRPMTQKLPLGCSIKYSSNRKYDGMISDGNEKSKIVKKILENPATNGYCYDRNIDIYTPTHLDTQS